MTDRDGGVGPISRAAEVTATGAVHRHVGQEQLDLYERMLGDGQRPVAEVTLDLVTTLTRDEIQQIEEHLPGGLTIASILGRALEYHPVAERRHPRHLPPGDGHVDVEA